MKAILVENMNATVYIYTNTDGVGFIFCKVFAINIEVVYLTA